MTEPTPRRLRIVRMSKALLAGLLRMDGGKRVMIEGLPEDARLLEVSDECYFDKDDVALKFESAEFAEVDNGMTIPELALVCTEIVDSQNRGYEFL